MVNWDKSVDLLIAGSGGGGMVAALAAVDSGIEPLVVEKQDLVGGSTGMSGGMVWLPNNPLMRDEGIPDSHEDGLAYFDDVVGDIGEVSSPARREMFLTAGFEMINFLRPQGCSTGEVPRAGATTTRITRAATLPVAPSRESRSTPPRSATGATRSSRRWPRTTDSSSRPTSCARCSTSTGHRALSPWRCGCSCAPTSPRSVAGT